ncbi:MAG: pyridoxamine 5'-phosphate oxidase family protein [Myxococcota bacterium]
MAEAIDNYERVSIYPLDPTTREALLTEHKECSFAWTTRDGWPVAVIMSYVWHEERFWLTAGGHRHRISAVRRDPRVCITVTSTGTSLGPGKSITVKGRCILHEDAETKAWFYPRFSRHLEDNERRASAFEERLDSPLRVVLEVVPEKWITYDGVKMARDAAGKLDASERGPALSADEERLTRELARRRTD